MGVVVEMDNETDRLVARVTATHGEQVGALVRAAEDLYWHTLDCLEARPTTRLGADHVTRRFGDLRAALDVIEGEQ